MLRCSGVTECLRACISRRGVCCMTAGGLGTGWGKSCLSCIILMDFYLTFSMIFTALDSLCPSDLRHLRGIGFTQKPILTCVTHLWSPVVAGDQERKTGRDIVNWIRLCSNQRMVFWMCFDWWVSAFFISSNKSSFKSDGGWILRPVLLDLRPEGSCQSGKISVPLLRN